MTDELRFYDVFPSVVKADQVSTIRIQPRAKHALFRNMESMEVLIYPDQGPQRDGSERIRWDSEFKAVRPEKMEVTDGTLEITAFFAGEQEHLIRVIQKDCPLRWHDNFPTPGSSPSGVRQQTFHIYSCREDLLALRPFRGDLHTHSNYSDGAEDPLYSTAVYRKLGFDFVAVTDHHHYTKDAAEFWKDLPCGFKVCPGEEVHLPVNVPGSGVNVPLENNVHILAFGTDRPVTEQALRDPETFHREVTQIEKELPQSIRPETRWEAAVCEWAFDRIRKANGLSAFCHPYWRMLSCEVTESVIDLLLKRGKFDLLEVPGGFSQGTWDEAAFGIARYYEEAAKGRRYPAIGVSDAHRTGPTSVSGTCYTIVFAGDSSLESLKSALKKGNCVAVENMSGTVPHLAGPFRLLRYTAFLMKNYAPRHRELCEVDGALLLELLSGAPDVRKEMELRKDRVSLYQGKYFASL